MISSAWGRTLHVAVVTHAPITHNTSNEIMQVENTSNLILGHLASLASEHVLCYSNKVEEFASQAVT